jgi:hypothetical protein
MITKNSKQTARKAEENFGGLPEKSFEGSPEKIFGHIIRVFINTSFNEHSYQSDGKMLKTFSHTKVVFSKRLFQVFI